MKIKNKKRKALKTNKKIIFLSGFLAFLFLGFIVQLFRLQILDVNNYKSKGNNQSRISSETRDDRGDIFDRNGNPLAVTQKVDSLYLLPVTSEGNSKNAEAVRQNEEQFNKLNQKQKDEIVKQSSLPIYKEKDIEKLALILGISKNEIFEKIAEGKEQYIYKALNNNQKSQIDLMNLKYLRIISTSERFYPNKEMLSNTLGFLEDGEAKYGLEKYYDQVLSGKPGYREFYKALQGTEIPYTNNKSINFEESDNIVTTINVDLQKILYKHLKTALLNTKAMSATAILMDPNTGEVLAMDSLPTFDSNHPRELNSEIDKIYLDKMGENKSTDYLLSKWSNKAVSMTYDPGSVYKTITASIALEADSKLKDKIYDDNGYYTLAPGVVIKSWRYWDPHGKQDLKEAFKNSSNPVFVQVAEDVGKARYIDYGQSFRLGEKTGIDLPNEAKGFYPKNSNISDVDFGTMSYGHFINANPMQIISSLNSTVNGGKYFKPHILKEIVDKNNKKIFESKSQMLGRTISEKTSEEIRSMLEYTADSYKYNTEELKFGAKTGTTVKYKSESIFVAKDDNSQQNVTSVFVAYPSHSPKYTLLVVLDEALSSGFAGQTAAPVGKDIIYEVAQYELGKPINVENDKKLVELPDFKGKTFEEASQEIEKLGIKASSKEDIGMYHIISGQDPKVGNLIEESSVIKLTFEKKIRIADFKDFDVKNLKELLELNKIKYEIKGDGKKVESQSIKAGTIVSDKEVIKFTTKE